MKCEMIVRVILADDGLQAGEESCAKDAIFCDNGLRMCFTCARAMVNAGDILTANGTRRFREIERVVYSLPS